MRCRDRIFVWKGAVVDLSLIHIFVPRAKERNPQLLDVLCRSMNLIADEDDMLEAQAEALRCV